MRLGKRERAKLRAKRAVTMAARQRAQQVKSTRGFMPHSWQRISPFLRPVGTQWRSPWDWSGDAARKQGAINRKRG